MSLKLHGGGLDPPVPALSSQFIQQGVTCAPRAA